MRPRGRNTGGLAHRARWDGGLSAASDAVEAALAISVEIESPSLRAEWLTGLARVRLDQAHLADAARTLLEALALIDASAVVDAANTLEVVARLLPRVERPDVALALFDFSDDYRAEIDSRRRRFDQAEDDDVRSGIDVESAAAPIGLAAAMALCSGALETVAAGGE